MIEKQEQILTVKDQGVSARAISVYTVLMVLRNMRDRLGLEAMADFLDSYTRIIEEASPEIKEAVVEELFERGLNGLYQAVCDAQK